MTQYSAQIGTQIIAQIKWRCYRLAASTSAVGGLAALLLLLALAGYFFAYQPLAHQLAYLQKAAAQPVKASQLPPISLADQLAAYVKQFPAKSTRANQIDALMALVARHGLQLDEVRYKADAALNQPFSRYQVAFGVLASYPEIHQLISAILTEMPNVALDTLEISRENVLDEVVEARIQFTFYFAEPQS